MSSQGFQQVQRQSQNLVLAPQLRQSLKILQSATLDLRTAIIEELEMNPTLEELPMDGVSLEEQSASTEDSADDSGDEASEMDFEENYEILNRMDEDLRELYAQENANSNYSSEAEEKRQHFFDSLTTESSLQEHLMRQAELADIEPKVLEAFEYLIGSLDDRGFITQSPSDVALMGDFALEDVQKAHKLLKSLDPPGIGAKDVQECLIIQLRQQRMEMTIAGEIVRDYFQLLLRRRIPEIARKLAIGTDQVQEALEDIAQLNPAPGRKFSDDNNRVVVPDVKVEKDNGEWIVIMNNDYIPRLRISPAYKEMMAKGILKGKEKEYLQERVRSGKFLINSIEQRQQTIERITRVILKYQMGFFEEGVSKLRPLTMNQVAEEVGVHETTVSRAIAGKYIDTPHGTYDFKYFFTPGYSTGTNGESVSNTSIKEMISKIIEHEDSSKPYSDQAIVKVLSERGITIARRTVAKYREELGILPTNLRRNYV